MSVTIDPANLANAVARRPFGYLITVSPNGEPHLRAVVFVPEGNALVAAVGQRSADNVTMNGKATLLWPPHIGGAEEFDDHTVIADGNATVQPRDDGASVCVVAYSAVWHRPVRPVAPD